MPQGKPKTDTQLSPQSPGTQATSAAQARARRQLSTFILIALLRQPGPCFLATLMLYIEV